MNPTKTRTVLVMNAAKELSNGDSDADTVCPNAMSS